MPRNLTNMSADFNEPVLIPFSMAVRPAPDTTLTNREKSLILAFRKLDIINQVQWIARLQSLRYDKK